MILKIGISKQNTKTNKAYFSSVSVRVLKFFIQKLKESKAGVNTIIFFANLSDRIFKVCRVLRSQTSLPH